MRKIFPFTAVCALFLLAGAAAAQDAKKLIVGKWESAQKGPDNVDYKVDAEFKADGTLTMEVRALKIAGKYTFFKDDVIDTESTFDGKTIKSRQEVKVTQDSLELKDAAGQVFKFKRKPSS